MKAKKIIVAITGASGVIYGIRMLEILQKLNIETHVIISQTGYININLETNYKKDYIKNLASYVYNNADLTARVASGSYIMDGMIVIPCSMKSLASISNALENNLISRAASVIIKERKKLVLVPRETPLHTLHIENMLRLSRMNVIISPNVPAFYNHPSTINDIVDHFIMRMLDMLGIQSELAPRWNGLDIKAT